MKKLSIIVPVFNEEKTIEEIIHRIKEVRIANFTKEIIVVNDGSTDSTASTISKIKFKMPDIKIIMHEKNSGKGSAVRTGLKNATGDYVLIQDADLEYNPNDIEKLLEPIDDKKNHQAVYGTRLKRLPNFSKDERTFRFFTHYLGNKILSFITSILYGQWVTDMETCYKLFPRDALKGIQLKSRGFDFEPEITAKLLKRKYKIIEIPISTNPRSYNEGKKLNTIRDGIIALWTLIKFRCIE